MASQPQDPTFFADFEIHDIVYKVVDDHNISLSIIVPRNLLDSIHPPEDSPLIVQFHGGFMVGGARLYSPWFPKWLLELAIAKRAIIVAPDYRLLPESSGLDILSDLATIWSWVQTDLGPNLAEIYHSQEIKPDLERIMVAGQSAGGYLAAQSMLLHPEMNIKSVILAYPMLDLRDDYWQVSYDKPIFGLPNLPYEIVEQHLQTLPNGRIVSSDGDPLRGDELSRTPLALSIVQNGKFLDFFGRESILFPMENIGNATILPNFIWLFHGREDTAVPFIGSERFHDTVRRLKPDQSIFFDPRPGDHGFDGDATLQSGWMETRVTELGQYW